MCPILSKNYQVDRLKTHTEQTGNLPLVKPTSFVQPPYLHYLGFDKFVHSMGSSVLMRPPLPALGNHIPDIVRASSKKKMIGTNTPGRVALMENPQSVRDRPAIQNPRTSMGLYEFFTEPGTKVAVIPKARACRPEPTRTKLREMSWWWTVLVYLRPKSLRERLTQTLRGKVLGRNLLHVSLVVPLGLLAQRHIYFPKIDAFSQGVFSRPMRPSFR